MSINRETVYAALFAQISGNGAFTTTTRKFLDINNSPMALWPALYQREGPMDASERDVYGQPIYRIKAWWFIYMQCSPTSDTLPETALNALILTAMNTLTPPNDQTQTLGDAPQVLHAYVDGEVIVYPGLLPDDVKAFAVIPITVDCGS